VACIDTMVICTDTNMHVEFELDARNLKHFLEDHPERGITRSLLEDVASNKPRVQPNQPNKGRSASHKVVGPDSTGRVWTFPAVLIRDEKWRPITGWPSTPAEIARYDEDSNGQSEPR
jgi:hypothetical protein